MVASTDSLLSISLALLGCAALALAPPGSAAAKPPVERTPIEQWLALGPLPARPPLFASGQTEPAADDAQRPPGAELLDWDQLDLKRLWPEAGAPVEWLPGTPARWRDAVAPAGALTLSPPPAPAIAYVASYVRADRYLTVDLVARGRRRIAIYLDGEKLKSADTALAADQEPAETRAPLKLKPGVHRLTLKLLALPGDRLEDWITTVELERKPDLPLPERSTAPRHAASWTEFLEAPTLGGVRLGPDGRWVAYESTQWQSDGRQRTRIEVRSTGDGALRRILELGGGTRDPAWSPDGRLLAFVVAAADPDQDQGDELWLWDRESEALERLLGATKGLAKPWFDHDGAFLYYLASVAPEEKEPPKVRRFRELWERWDTWPTKTHLFVLSLADRVRHQLTAGDYSVAEAALAPDGGSLAILRIRQIQQRPFSQTELWLLDLTSLSERLLRTLRFGQGGLSWSPDGQRIAMLAAINEVEDQDGDGHRNSTQTEVFAVRVADGGLERLSPGFGPSFEDRTCWNPADGRIYASASAGMHLTLYRSSDLRASIDNPVWEPVELPMPVAASVDLSRDGAVLAAAGSGLDQPGLLVARPTSGGAPTTLASMRLPAYRHVDLGRFEPWSFTNSAGRSIEGFLLFPPDFDPARRHPLIVYYYGGVLPTRQAFSFPFQWLAGHGYVIYVLNPGGTVGYGADFADLHVGDWGARAAGDVLEGLDRLLAAKSYLDPAAVGAYGGSYGGFMTMTLASKSDKFAALASVAGISNITSYWGAGWWGYWYTDVTLPGGMPWERPDVFVERSPLFHADRIKTPLLLVHGSADINVPPGESDQMFAALRLLGREVTLVRFKDQGHSIGLTDFKALQARYEILREFFDRHLRGRPEAWEARWQPQPKPADAR